MWGVSSVKVMVTGFEPFGEYAVNPTERLVQSVSKAFFEGITVETAVLPVVFDVCVERLLQTVEKVRPDIVICCGLAAGRTGVTVERIGINMKDVGDGTARKDNNGSAPHAEKIIRDGPDGLFATIPAENIVRRMKDAGIPAAISNTAGTYICNNTLYGLLYAIQQRKWPIRGGFIHFPATPEMAADRPSMPSMSLDTMEHALKIAITTAAVPD